MTDANLWHRLGNFKRKSRDPLKRQNYNGVSFDGAVSHCDVCAEGKSRQLTHPKTADRKVTYLFQLAFAYLMRPITPEAVRGYKYVSNISDRHTK